MTSTRRTSEPSAMWAADCTEHVLRFFDEQHPRDARDHRGQRYHRALRGLSARWTRVLWRCWTDHTCYDQSLHTSAAAHI